MRRVAQRVSTDCGIAATATIADVSYEDAKAAFVRFRGRGFGTKAKDVRRALESLGIQLAKRRRDLRGHRTLNLDFDALVQVTLVERGREITHWIVWDSAVRRFFDPARTCPRTTYQFDHCYKIKRSPTEIAD